jgi:ATP-dependent protease ClpP protease subunit
MKKTAARQTDRITATAAGIGGCAQKAYDFLETGEDELEINMYGEVVQSIPVDWWTGKPIDGMFISEKDFLEDLDKYREKSRITVRINSVGGDLYAGLAIANRLKDLKADIVTIADALCASAAVSIYQTGSTRKLYAGSQIMIHEPSCRLFGRYDVQGIQKVARQLEAGKKSLIESYRERTGRTSEELEQMITGDCWMTGQEAVTEGFADEVIEGEVKTEVTEDNKTVISNGICFPAEAFYSLPRNLAVHRDHAENGIMPDQNKQKQEGGEVLMTKSELMEKYPSLWNEISSEAKEEMKAAVDEAVKAERTRIQNIDEIAGQVGDEAMVREAKFGETTMDASKLALAALKKQSQLGSDFLRNMKEDAKSSKAEEVTPAPNSGTKSQEEQELQDIMDGAALIIGKKEGEQK